MYHEHFSAPFFMLLFSLCVSFGILCLTTDPIHQGHEKRKKSVTSARSSRTTSSQMRVRKLWEAVTSICLGNGRSDASCKQHGGVSGWYKQISVSASYKQYVSDACTSRQKHNMLSLLHAACLKLLVFYFMPLFTQIKKEWRSVTSLFSGPHLYKRNVIFPVQENFCRRKFSKWILNSTRKLNC